VSDKRLSEAEIDRLTSNLQKKLRRERLRPGLWFLIVLSLAVAIGYGVWRAVQMPAILPPVMLVCYDALGIEPDPVIVDAQLIAPGDPGANLDDQEIFWEISRNGAKTPFMTRTSGCDAHLTIDRPVAGETIPVRVWFINPQANSRRDDQARVDVVGKGAVQIAPVEQVADAEPPIDWLNEKAAAIAVKPGAAKLRDAGLPTVYCSGDVSPAVYRSMRSWLRSKFDQKEGLPAGVLLRGGMEGPIERMEAQGIEVKKLETGK